MKLGDKEFELNFTYGSLKKIATSLGCEMHEVTAHVAEMGDNITKVTDFCILCILHASGGVFKSVEEVEECVTSFDIVQPAASEFLKAWSEFFKIKAGDDAGE